MKLNSYSIVEYNLFNSNYINPLYKRLYCNDIEYHKHYCFLKRFNTTENNTDYFIALFDSENNIAKCRQTVIKNGTVKIDLYSVWKELQLSNLNKITIVYLEEYDKQPDGIVYKLNILS